MIRFVIGAPGSGKSTYVAEHARPGEIIVDFDALAYALGSPVTDHHLEDHPPAILSVAHAAWLAAVRRAEALEGVADVWVVRANPTPREVKIMQRTGVVIRLDAQRGVLPFKAPTADSPETCHLNRTHYTMAECSVCGWVNPE